MKVLVLMHEDLVPPESIKGLTDQEMLPFKTEFDVTTALQDMGHEVLPLGVASDLGVLRDTLNQFKPRITFNLLEEFHGVAVYDQHVVSYLELMKRRYTGCNPRGLMLARDKGLSKRIMSSHRIPVPDFEVFTMGRRIRARRKVGYPMVVKSLIEEGSDGITSESVVHDDAQLTERVRFVHEEQGTDAIGEAYIEGRELYLGIMGNDRLQTMPLWELDLSRSTDPGPKIATAKVKWDVAYQEKHKIRWGKAKQIPDELGERIRRACKRAYKVLNLTGYARIDLRLREDGKFFILEANPNPDVSYGGEFADSAEQMGLSYEKLLDRILRLGLRYRAAWQD